MRTLTMALAAGALLVVFAAPTGRAASLGTGGITARAWPRGEATVGYRNEPALRAALARFPATIVRRIPALRVAHVRPRGSAAAWAEAVAALPGITHVDRLAPKEDAAEPALLPAAGTLPWEWQYTATRADTVPDWVLREASAITIAVIDTGADLSAPDLAAKTPSAYNGRNGSGEVRDTFGHGTFVSALAAGSVTNGDGIAGFGGDAKLLVVKAGRGDGSFTDVDEAQAIVYAVDQGARVINLSLGGPSTSVTERKAIDYAVEHGVLIVAAAGNEYDQGNPVEYPAALLQPVGSRGVGGRGLAVGASTMSGARASFSNTGTHISLVAPGDTVFSAVSAASPAIRFPRVTLPGARAGLYGFASGTSFAAPEVAGAAALVWATNPLLDAPAVARILKESATGHGAWTSELGFGVLDVGAAVERARGVEAATATATITLGSSLSKKFAVLNAKLRSAAPGVPAASRTVLLESFDGTAWSRKAAAATSRRGEVRFRVRLGPGTHHLRVRWGGAADLAGAVSKPVVLRVARSLAAR
jgi:subtilisin family serine protease